MGRIIAIANQKEWERRPQPYLSAALAARGKKTLIIDGSPGKYNDRLA